MKIKTYSLVLVGTETRVIRSWNTGHARNDLDAAMQLAKGYTDMACNMRVECNGELVWASWM